MPRSAPLLILLATAGALLVVLLARSPGEPGAAPDPQGPAPSPLDVAPILAELRSLREAEERTAGAIGRLETALRDQRLDTVQTSRQPAGAAAVDGWTRLAASVDALRLAVEEGTRATRAALEQSEAGALAQSLEQRPSIDPLAVDALIAAWQSDGDGARRETLLWTPARVVATYGRPTEVWRSAESGLFFAYVRDWGPAGEEPLQVGFRICDGVVVDSWLEPYRPDGAGD